MRKIDAVVRRETLYIAAWVTVFSVILQAVFLAVGKWDYTVLLGNLLSAVSGILNFFLMGLTVQSAVSKEQKDARNLMKFSQSLRLLLLFVVAIFGAVLPCFHLWATVIPLLFPRIAVALHPLMNRRRENHVSERKSEADKDEDAKASVKSSTDGPDEK